MKTYKIENLTHSVGTKTVFKDITFAISEGDKVGLIGVNGTGKSTFLNIVSEINEPDQGNVQKPQDFSVGYLRQKDHYSSNHTVLDTVFEGETPIIKAVKHYEKILVEFMKNPENEKLQDDFTAAEQKMNQENAWLASTNAKTILNKLGITELTAQMETLSGGQIKRVMLARVLIQEPDLLILDEPTNHLDYLMITWLENYLKNYNGSVLVVTHDRYFLNNTINKIVELDHGKLYEYPGNYEAYVELKAQREETEAIQAHKNKQLYKQELAWMREGVRARGTKVKSRVDNFKNIEEEVKDNQNASSNLEMNFQNKRLGNKVIELEDASLNLSDHKILDDFNLLIQNSDRIGVTGKNASGKSTLLNVIAKRIPLDSGTLTIGETVKIGYYTQKNEGLDESKRVINYLQETAEGMQNADGSWISISQILERFLFERPMHGALISKLSGGEKRRLYLLNILIQQPNVLLLDEPTNDLDIQTLTVLENYLETFNGTVLAVSHDRYFLDKMADKLLMFKGNGVIDAYFGTLSEYLETQNEENQAKFIEKPKEKQAKPKVEKEKTRLNYTEQKEWETIEEDMFALDEKVSELETNMLKYGSDLEKLQELTKARNEASKHLEDKMERWEYLAQFVEE